MIKWTKRLIAAFGASFLWLICLIYFTQMQGFWSFVWTAISYQLKDRLKLSPSASQYVSSIAFFPWSIKPLYGIMSDCIPIRGRKRIPYLVIATVLSLVPWLILGSHSTSRDSKCHLMVFLAVQNLGSAMADVVVDAMIAEAARYDRFYCDPSPQGSPISSSIRAPATACATTRLIRNLSRTLKSTSVLWASDGHHDQIWYEYKRYRSRLRHYKKLFGHIFIPSQSSSSTA